MAVLMKSTPPVIQTDMQLACADIQELVSFLSADGNLPGDIITPEFFVIFEKARSESLTPDEEFKFWNGFSQLAQHAKPTQVEALQFRNYILGKKPIGRATEERYRRNLAIIRNIRILSLISFIVTLMLFTYLSLTEGYMARNDSLATEYRLIASGIHAGTRLEGLQESNFRTVIQEGNAGGSEGGGEGGGEGGSEVSVARPESSGGSPAGFAGSDAYFRTQVLNALSEISSLIGHNTAALRLLQFDLGEPAQDEEDELAQRFSIKDLRVEARQQSINHLLSSYILPVFTSLLGVTVYILRRTSTSINAGQYRLYESGTYSYRITLGIVGGIVISWFSITDSSGVISSITPAALAFLVGYSIEVLYNVLDSIVKALGARDSETA
jgi:hypothetical protein